MLLLPFGGWERDNRKREKGLEEKASQPACCSSHSLPAPGWFHMGWKNKAMWQSLWEPLQTGERMEMPWWEWKAMEEK